ncbi:MAG: GntR family transcriptional regulator [Alphaproteobacteria bacterium]|nr:GntR family transcriptional regulator [Alphaproteobacteria bacterium]
MPLPRIELSQASGVPFYRQLHDQLAASIQSGALPPGTLLPSVRALAQDTLVSLITVRRAYADLEAAGLIERRQGQGTFVTEPPADARQGALDDARTLLTDAVHHARLLGLDDAAQAALLRTLLPGAFDVPDRD